MRVIFLDRDGVINKYPGDYDYVKSWDEFQFLPRAKEALKGLKGRGFKLFVVSNQAGVSKGIYSQGALDLITQNMLKALGDFGVELDGVYYCIHRPEDNCACRKPKTGFLEAVIETARSSGQEIDLAGSYFIGDTERDVQTGRAAGLKTILVFSGKEKPENKDNWKIIPDFTALDLAEAAKLILK